MTTDTFTDAQGRWILDGKEVSPSAVRRWLDALVRIVSAPQGEFAMKNRCGTCGLRSYEGHRLGCPVGVASEALTPTDGSAGRNIERKGRA